MNGIKASEGRETLESQCHAQRPRTSMADGNISAVSEFLEEDWPLSVHGIASPVGLNQESEYSIIKGKLGFLKISECWVPRKVFSNV